MDSKKILVLILVVIAILAVMAIGVGYHRDSTDPEYEQKSAFNGLDPLFARFRDTFDLRRLSGCNWNGESFGPLAQGDCEITIATGISRSSGFELIPTAGIVHACFGFERDQLEKCVKGDADKRSRLERGKSRFVAGKDSAILILYCVPAGSNACSVRLSREE